MESPVVTISGHTTGHHTAHEHHHHHSESHGSGKDRVAVLLMGYGEVESYEDFANYNEQALNLLTAKFAPVPTWI